MALFNLGSLAASYVSRGLQMDSLRRQLNRQNIATKVGELRDAWVNATDDWANQSFIQSEPKTFVPTSGYGMVDREFKQPWSNRYVLQVNYIDPSTGERGSTDLSLNRNKELSVGEAERQGLDEALNWSSTAAARYLPEGAIIENVEMVNAYHNA